MRAPFDPYKYSSNPSKNAPPERSVRSQHLPSYRVDKPYRRTPVLRADQIISEIRSSKNEPSPIVQPESDPGISRVSQRYKLRSSVNPVEGPALVNDINEIACRPRPDRSQRGKNRKWRSQTPFPDGSDYEFRSSRAGTPTIKPDCIPTPSAEYLSQSALPPTTLQFPQPLLLVMDLNGTLILRHKRSKTKFIVRANAQKLISHMLVHYTVMIWSSAQPGNVKAITEKLFTPQQRKKLIAIWGRDKLDLSKADYTEKVQVYKKLQKVWNDTGIQSTYPTAAVLVGVGDAGEADDDKSIRKWDQTNTVLIDDSTLKAAAQPYNLVEVPEFVDNLEHERGGLPVLDDVKRTLEILSYQEDVSRYLRALREKEGVGKAEEMLIEKIKELEEVTDNESDDEEGGMKLILPNETDPKESASKRA
jgi:hypothetical protein